MKKITFLFLVFFTVSSFAQKKFHQITCDTKTSIEKQKENGSFTFIFPDQIDKEQIDRTAKFYTNYFVVSFNNKTKSVQIRMTVNDQNNRRVIKRFLISNKIEEIILDDQIYTVDNFYNQFLK
ncbi:MAG: hypothetical protein HYU67_09260 [Flavobacteriia bacterium]|nr:hypothetical protein [Flavobacteriia bacterium]